MNQETCKASHPISPKWANQICTISKDRCPKTTQAIVLPSQSISVSKLLTFPNEFNLFNFYIKPHIFQAIQFPILPDTCYSRPIHAISLKSKINYLHVSKPTWANSAQVNYMEVVCSVLIRLALGAHPIQFPSQSCPANCLFINPCYSSQIAHNSKPI